jgi:hypothetical protein
METTAMSSRAIAQRTIDLANWFELALRSARTGIVLANAGSGASALDVVCFGPLPNSTISAYAFNDWKALEAALRDSSLIGFAVPLESDKFTVVRFPLVGRSDAQQAIESVFLAKTNKQGQDKARSTVDQTL